MICFFSSGFHNCDSIDDLFHPLFFFLLFCIFFSGGRGGGSYDEEFSS